MDPEESSDDNQSTSDEELSQSSSSSEEYFRQLGLTRSVIPQNSTLPTVNAHSLLRGGPYGDGYELEVSNDLIGEASPANFGPGGFIASFLQAFVVLNALANGASSFNLHIVPSLSRRNRRRTVSHEQNLTSDGEEEEVEEVPADTDDEIDEAYVNVEEELLQNTTYEDLYGPYVEEERSESPFVRVNSDGYIDDDDDDADDGGGWRVGFD